MAKLINGYGITETTVYSTFKVISEEDIRARSGSIGRPVSGTYVYILGPDMSLCPMGVVGELYIGGLGVGRGYLGRHELTKRRFVDDPFRPGHVLYRSGDLTRWLENGEIEYLGRADAQVKVRGYRVEIPEIEAVLTSQSAIGESVVLAEARRGTTQLIGFFTSPKQEDLTELRRHLEEHLPNYMVPSRLVQVERIPVTPNGKVDRAALLSAHAAVPPPKRSANNAVEEQIAQAWSSVLGISSEQISSDSSFFTVGGDSIGANLVVRLLANRGLPVELLDLFENPTLSGLANVILSKDQDTSSEAERTAYWSAIGSTPVAPSFGPSDANAGAPHRVTIQIPLGALPARGESELRDILLTALGLSLRMWSGGPSCRVGVVQRGDGGLAMIAPLILTIKDLNLARENLATVRDAVRRAQDHQMAWHKVVATPAYRSAVAGGVLFHYDETPADGAEEVACMIVDCRMANGAATLTFIARATSADRLQLLAETFQFAFRQTLQVVPAAPARLRPTQIHLDAKPFNDVFFKDCTHQALMAALKYFDRDIHPVLANTVAFFERDAGRARGLRVRAKYLDRRALDEVLADSGVSMHQSSASADVCEDLLECLWQGALGIVKVDCYFVEKQRDLFHRKHGEHTILVCGYDEGRRQFEIIDNEAAYTVQYRRTTIGFDELRAAYAGFQELFNPRGAEVSYLAVSETPGHYPRRYDDALLRREALETLRLTHARHDEERAALALLHDDFWSASVSESMMMEHVEPLCFTFGEILLTKRLQRYQLAHILGDPRLTRLVEKVIDRLEDVHNVLTKMRVSRTYSAAKVQFLRAKLDEAQRMDFAYAAALAVVRYE